VIEPVSSSSARRPELEQGLEIDRDHHVRALATNRWTLAGGEPLAADLAERVGPPLSGRAGVGPTRRAGLRVHLSPDGRDQTLPVRGIELGVYPRHAMRVGADVQSSPFVAAILVLHRPHGIGGNPPGPGQTAELSDAHRARGLEERRFGACEGLGGCLLRRGQHLDSRFRDLALAERPRYRRHRLERAGATHPTFRDGSRHALAMSEPSGRRQVAIGGVDLPTLELGHPSPALGLEDASGPLDLVQVAPERLVRERAEVLGSKLVEGRSEAAHGLETIEQVFESL
jgi:hypothetical protein